MGTTAIEWCTHSINPIRARHRKTGAVGHYCELFSGGCLHCYASSLQKRFKMPAFPGKSRLEKLPVVDERGCVIVSDDIELFLDETKLKEVKSRRKPAMWFWCDMTDLFGSWVPDAWIERSIAVMAATPQHVHQVLTKRAKRLQKTVDSIVNGPKNHDFWPNDWWHRRGDVIPNVWFGVSCEDQQRANERVPLLARTPGAVRFVSAEPLIGEIRFDQISVPHGDPYDDSGWTACDNFLTGFHAHKAGGCTDDKKIDWMIVGGESGRGSRPCNVEWIRSIVRQCRDASVPCFVKQMGSNPMREVRGDMAKVLFPNGVPPGTHVEGEYIKRNEFRFVHPKGGDPAEWDADLQVRQFPAVSSAV